MPHLSGIGLGAVSATSSTDVWAVANHFDYTPPITIHWNGSKWMEIPQVAQGSLSDLVAIAPDDVWAVGEGPTNPVWTAEHWDGTSWQLTPVPDPRNGGGYLGGVDAVSSADVWAVGYSYFHSIRPLTEHWDGAIWTAVPAPDGSIYATNAFYKVSAVSSADVWAVGYQDVTGAADFQPLIEHWDGNAWSVVESPLLPGDDNQLYDVHAISSNDVWAVGFASGPRPLIEHWDGSRWSVVTAPFPSNTIGNPLFGVSGSGSTDVWAVGESNSSSDYQPLTLHWDGSTWRLVKVHDPGNDASFQSIDVLSATDAWAVGASFSDLNGLRPMSEHFAGPCQ